MSKQKGDRVEREYEYAYQRAGYKTERSMGQRWGRTDWFGLFDVMCIHPDRPIRFAQVKSNRATGVRKAFLGAARLLPDEHAEVEYAVRHDGEGWRLIRPYDDDGRLTYRTVYDERKDPDVGPHVDTPLNLGEGLVTFLRAEIDAGRVTEGEEVGNAL